MGARGTGATGSEAPATEVSAPNIPAANFRITPELKLGSGGEVEKFNDNLAAIRALKGIESERRRATPEEQSLLARYVGWGGLANAFPDPMSGEFKDKWKARGEELRELLTPSEYAAARRSTRNAHYTSQTVVSAMWDAARRLGFRGGLALESSMGTGNFLGLAPEGIPTRFIGIEYDSLTARIAGLLYPQAAVLHTGFQRAPLANNAFALNIGNPPFGNESLRFQYKPELTGVSIHNQFFRAGIDAVRPGGLQIMVVSRFLMDAQDPASRIALATKARLVAAIRLPDTAFKENARTEVVTDIVILQRREPDQEQDAADVARWTLHKPTLKDINDMGPDGHERYERLMGSDLAAEMSWLETEKIADPLGGEAMTVNRYFAKNPRQILGTLERSGSMAHGADITVRLDDGKTLPDLLAAAVKRLPENISNIPDEVIAATEERFTLLAEALRIAVANEEPGHLKLDPDGNLLRVIEREAPDGGDFMARQVITPDSPWSEQLSMDAEGRWYRMEVVLDEQGKPAKVMKGDKATNRNLYARTTYQNDADVPASLRLGQAGYDRLVGMVGLRDLLKRQLVLETEDAGKTMMEGNRKRLARAYEAFVDEHGPINRPVNLRLAMTMPDGGLVAALESQYQPERSAAQAKKTGLDAQPEKATPAPILTARVVPKYEPATGANTAADALAISLAERGRVDMERIAQLRSLTPEQAAAELQAGDKPLVFMDPETQSWETADAYLSGLVKRKLAAARAAGLDLNVKALEAVQPETWTAENVTATLGATWVPAQVYADFAQHLTGGRARASFSPLTNSFSLTLEGGQQSKLEEWSADGASTSYILNRLLNSQPVVVLTPNADGDMVFDRDRTTMAILKGKDIVNEFADWVFKDGDRRAQLVDIFNDRFNTRVTRQFDGSHLKLPGKVPDAVLQMRRHQMNAIWRGISSRFLLLDHVVGAGKTFTGIARAMERRRMGLARKPVIMVPNHLVEQWAADVYRLYPGAKVLAAGQKDFEAKRRRRLFGRIATGDWDIVIVPHSSFGFIGIAPETEMRFLEAEMREAQQAIEDAWEQAREDGQDNGRRKPFGVKEAERLAEKLQNRMDKITSGARDKLLTFEQLGIDDLTVDEAHEFKNLYYSSRLTGVRGMGNKTGSRKAADLYNKVRVLRESGGAVTFMTGTPISNSAVEMFTMMRYLAADELAEQGLTHFDAWRAQYVEATPAFEPTESGRLKEVTRLGRSWSNMRSLMDLYYQFTDAVTIDDIKKWYAEDHGGKAFPVPKVKGGGRQLVKIKPTKKQEQLLEEILAGFDSLPEIEDPYERNIERLHLMDRARKVSLDVRAVDPRIPTDEKGGKLEKVSQEIKRIYDQWTPDRGTQAVFLDRSVPKAKGDDKILKDYDDLIARRDKALREGNEEGFEEASDALEKFDANEMAELRNAQAGGWNAYQQIKDNLVAMGIPAGEIRFIQEAANDEQKQALFDAVNGGKVRVIIGSTQRMGAGTNIQQRLVAEHHVDVTWKPSDIEQREGRIIRQASSDSFSLMEKYGEDHEVEILAYATERTIDAKMWDLNATKLKTINGIRKYDGAFTMEFEDEDSVSMAEMAALASGNPLLLERVTLESQISNLELQERAHRRKMYGVVDALERAQRAIEQNPAKIERARAQAADLTARVKAVQDAAAARSVTVEGQTFTSLMDASKAAQDAVELQQAGNEKARYALTINGKRVTNKEAIAEAIGAALGDAAPFEATILGSLYTQRTAAGREAAGVMNAKTVDDANPQASVKLGTMFGFGLEADIELSGKWKVASLSLIDKGRTVASAGTNGVEPHIAFTTGQIRGLLEHLEKTIHGETSDWTASYLQSQLDAAKRDLPDLEARQGEVWPKAQELADKRARLNAVVQQLSGAQAAPEVDDYYDPTGDTHPAGNDADQYLYRLGTRLAAENAASAMLVAEVEKKVKQLTANWKDMPPVKVVAYTRDLPGSQPKGTKALFTKTAIYIVADSNRTVQEIGKSLAHEAIMHLGQRRRLGRDRWYIQMGAINAALARGNLQLRKIQRDIRRLYVDKDGKFNLSPEIEADEIAARAIEASIDENGQLRPAFGYLKAVYAKVAEFLRSLGIYVHDALVWAGVEFSKEEAAKLKARGMAIELTMAELQGMMVLSLRNLETSQRPAQGTGQVLVAAARQEGADNAPMAARSEQWPDLAEAYERYSEEFGETWEDLLDVVDNLVQDDRAPAELVDAIEKARQELRENRTEYGGRGDMDSAEAEFVAAVEKALGRGAPTELSEADRKLAAMFGGKDGDFLSARDDFNADGLQARTATAPTFGTLDAAQEQALKNVGGIQPKQTVADRFNALRANLGLKITQGLFDQFAPIKTLDAKAYLLARMSKGAEGTMEAAMLYGKPFLRDGVADVDIKDGGFGQTLASLKGEHDRFLWWVAAQRAEKLKAEGRENLFTDADISALKTLNLGNFADGTGRTLVYGKALRELTAFNEAALKMAMDSGLIDQDAYDAMRLDPYVPFYRLMEDGGELPKFRSGSGLTNQQAFKKLKGGTDKLNNDLLQNLLLNWNHLFAASAKNRAALATMKAAADLMVAHKVSAHPSVPKGAVKIMRGGAAEYWQVEDPYLLEAISSLNYVPSPLLKPLAAMKHLLTLGVTANPAFKVRNLMRDSIAAIAQADLGYNPFKNVAKGWAATSRGSQTYASMLASGGLMKFGTQEDTGRARRQIEKLGGKLLDKQGWDKLTNQMAEVWEAYQEFGDRGENVNRAALYEKLIAQGKSHAEAAFMARDLMDFSMTGQWGAVRFLAQTVPFLNARLVGLHKLGRAAKEDPRRFATVAGSVMLASLALMLAYRDDEDWKRREDHDRDAHWWFKIGGTAFRIPKPFEIGAMGTLAERTAELMIDPEMTGQRFSKRVSAMLFQTFNFDPTPQAFKPLLDVYANKDSFTGRPIESMSDERLRPQDRIGPRTSEVARFLGQLGLPDPAQLAKGEYTPLSPKQVDFLLRGYFGWFGTVAQTIPDYGIRPLLDRGERPAMRLKDVFLAGNFLESLPSGSSRYVTTLYEQAREIEQAYASYHAALKSGDTEKAAQILQADGDKLRQFHQVQRVKRSETMINAQIRRIEANRIMSAEAKREQITQLEARKEQAARRLMLQ